jgi:hypothetical protein
MATSKSTRIQGGTHPHSLHGGAIAAVVTSGMSRRRIRMGRLRGADAATPERE